MILWDVNKGREIKTIRKPYFAGGIDHIAFSPDGHKAVTGGTDGIILWNVETGEMIHLFEGSFPSRSQISGPCVDFSPDGHFILTADSEEHIILWDAETYEKLRTFSRESNITGTMESRINSIKFSSDGRFALTSGDLLILWSVETGRVSHIFNGHMKNKLVVDAIITGDGQFVLSGGWDQTLRIWSMESGVQLQTIPLDHFQELISFSPDGRFAVTGNSHLNDSIKVWDIPKGVFAFALKPSKGKKGLSFSVSPDSRKVAIGLCGRLELRDIETGKKILTLRRNPTIPLILNDIIWRYVRI